MSAIALLMLGAGSSAAQVPKQIWGKWEIIRELPASTIACWSEDESRKLIHTEIEYAPDFFRWNHLVIKNPVVQTRIVGAAEFHDENSGSGTNASQVSFRELGIKAARATEVTIEHPAANITGATTEIPGDTVLLKGADKIVISACNVYFEAKRANNRH